MPPPGLPAEADTALRRFRAFYAELFAIKRTISEQDWEALLGRRAASAPVQEQLLRGVQTRLRRAIAAQVPVTSAPAGPAGVDPAYVMAALADEVLLHDVTWPALEQWAENPLEALLYRTRVAGDRIFQAVDAVTARNAPDTEGVGMMILLALQMGFRGRYRGRDDEGVLQAARERLYGALFRGRYRASADPGELVAGQAEPMTDRRPAVLPPLRPWLYALLGLAALYLVASYAVWLAQVSDVAAAAARIVDARAAP